MTYKVAAYKSSFDTIKKAAGGEKNVSWKNPDSEECVACTECFAALDLAETLKRIKKIDINAIELGKDVGGADALIFIGERCARYACELYNLPFVEVTNPEGYRIYGKEIDGKEIVLIYGAKRAGALYGAAAYMEYHGIRFISPGESGTYYNSELDRSDRREFDISESPSYKTRECYSEFMYDSRYDFMLWLVHNKLNAIFIKTIEFPERMHKLCLDMSEGGHALWYKYMDINQEYPYMHKVFGGDGKPSDPYPVSPLYKGDSNGDGILTYGEAHPEWYAETDGERKLYRNYEDFYGKGYATGDYICTSNEDGVTELCKLLVDSLSQGAMKHANCIKLSALDNGNWCQCERCRELPLSYRQLMLAYKLDKAIKKATDEGRINRKIAIRIAAYHETLPPPDRPLPDDFDYDTISVIFYVIERCYVHNINDQRCVETNKMLYDRLMSWVTGYYKGELTVGEYYNVSSFASMPFILTDRMFNDIPFYYEIGARHIHYMHMTASNLGLRAINDFAYAKLLWNVRYDKEAFKTEYYTTRYGAYSDKMRSIYEKLERVCANCKRIKHYQYVYNVRRELTNELKNKSTNIFDFNHMKFDGRADDYQAGPSLTETVNGFESCFDEFCEFIRDKDASIFKEDYEQLEYGMNTLKFLYYKVRAVLESSAEAKEQAAHYAGLLEKTTRPLDGYDVRILFKNGLTATRLLED